MPDPHDRRSALALSDAGGHGRVARVGLASAIVGQLIIAAAEVIWPSNRDLGDVLFSVSPILTGAGLVTVGDQRHDPPPRHGQPATRQRAWTLDDLKG